MHLYLFIVGTAIDPLKYLKDQIIISALSNTTAKQGHTTDKHDMYHSRPHSHNWEVNTAQMESKRNIDRPPTPQHNMASSVDRKQSVHVQVHNSTGMHS